MTQKKNGKLLKPEEIKTEEDFRRYLRESNHPLGDLIIKAREETERIFGRLLTENEIKELILER